MEEFNDKIKNEEGNESSQPLPLHEDKLKDNDDIDTHPQDNEYIKESKDKIDENPDENYKEQNDDGLDKENMMESSAKIEEEYKGDGQGKINDQMKEDEMMNKEGKDLKEPLNNKEETEEVELKGEAKKNDDEIEDKTNQSSYYPKLYYNYQTMQKSNDYLGDSKGIYESMPYTYTLRNSTNYISSKDPVLFSPYNSYKDGFDYGNTRSSFTSNKDDVLVQKTKKVLSDNSNINDKPEESVANNEKRSYSSFNRSQYVHQNQPQRSYYLSSYNQHEKEQPFDFKPIASNRNALLNKYTSLIKDDGLTYSFNSSSHYATTNQRIQSIKDKYKYTPFKSNLSSAIGTNYTPINQRVSYQYESNPINRLRPYQSSGRLTSSYFSSSYIQPEMNYTSRYRSDRFCCCCHCRRG